MALGRFGYRKAGVDEAADLRRRLPALVCEQQVTGRERLRVERAARVVEALDEAELAAPS